MKEVFFISLTIILQITTGYFFFLFVFLSGINVHDMGMEFFWFPFGVSIIVVIIQFIVNRLLKREMSYIPHRLLACYIAALLAILSMYKYEFGGYLGIAFFPLCSAIIVSYGFDIYKNLNQINKI